MSIEVVTSLAGVTAQEQRGVESEIEVTEAR